MTPIFRGLLIIAASFSFVYTMLHLRKSKLLIADTLFWFFFSFLLVLLAIFPQIAYFFADLLGIISTVNLVYLVIISLLIYRIFRMQMRISELDIRLKQLIEDLAVQDCEKQEKE